jgi:hypothetical protein
VRDLTDDRDALRRVCERLRSLPESRLIRVRPDSDGSNESIATEVHRLCCWAAAAQGLPYPVPRLNPLASGDQLAVIGAGLIDWVSADESEAAGSVLESWRARVLELRTRV